MSLNFFFRRSDEICGAEVEACEAVDFETGRPADDRFDVSIPVASPSFQVPLGVLVEMSIDEVVVGSSVFEQQQRSARSAAFFHVGESFVRIFETTQAKRFDDGVELFLERLGKG